MTNSKTRQSPFALCRKGRFALCPNNQAKGFYFRSSAYSTAAERIAMSRLCHVTRKLPNFRFPAFPVFSSAVPRFPPLQSFSSHLGHLIFRAAPRDLRASSSIHVPRVPCLIACIISILSRILVGFIAFRYLRIRLGRLQYQERDTSYLRVRLVLMPRGIH
ncbi:hypothetical protein RvY_01059-2 [Ramazzottius varieornatus]|uniref:Uncharacterized protein n=1 Tax=Ramazzottius varieornatus TaxID=947166 RepID=A0A1D1UQB4_RAMVA|nr:hypothetical protein RvY_01059-2 [Ramazzottius varieornatus]